jgi:cytochrome P450
MTGLIEEGLRYDAPLQLMFRRATRNCEIAGTHIPAGASITLLLGSANRDERQFEDPDRFDPTRSAKGHLAFGFGPHFCLGAALARLEARAALNALLPQLPGLERTHGTPSFVDSFMVRGLSRLELQRPRKRELCSIHRRWSRETTPKARGARRQAATTGVSHVCSLGRERALHAEALVAIH